MSTVISQLTAMLTERLGIEPSKVQSDATFEQLDLDSLAVVELTEMLQDEFQVTLSDDDITHTNSLSDVIALLHSRGVLA
ncbi:acyl carrier protein [Streptomyces sp. YC504]|uniref:Acyl carrier protein n=1 Tax=Streptomyces mesophilus TaxID=1775132 RepID=A0A6G4X982_9ACTN|nr:phosphopantetheine-binding protein [Streptomyces mesophilus]NGO74109.1 acyl carrier protein [Streptomyces mesophilus]